MASVTQRIRQVRQPYGGYINPKAFDVRYLGPDGVAASIDHTVENVHPSLVGTAVDYLTRWCLDYKQLSHTSVAERVFGVSCAGASMVDRQLGTRYVQRAEGLCRFIDESRVPNLEGPTNPSPEAIAAAIELASFDGAARAGLHAFNPDANTIPDDITTAHIATMVADSLAFFRRYGPVLVDGFTALGGYTATVDAGDGDFVTMDTLWDFKVSAKPPTRDHTLQLLMYWLLARRSDWNWTPVWNWSHKMSEPDWREVWDLDTYLREHEAWPEDLRGPVPTHIGIFNPRLNSVYRLPVASIAPEVIADVSSDVLGIR